MRRLRARTALALPVLVLAAFLIAAGTASTKVVGENTDDLPPGCDEVAGDVEITVRGGREHAEGFPGAVFTFDQRVYEYEPCTRVTATFVNDDPIRHQWMVHGTWPDGFFLLEVDGPGQETGSFIVPAQTMSLMVHCGLAQHQQKGMKAELLVNGGVGDIPNILGVSGVPPDDFQENGAPRESTEPIPAPGAGLAALAVACLALVGARWRR